MTSWKHLLRWGAAIAAALALFAILLFGSDTLSYARAATDLLRDRIIALLPATARNLDNDPPQAAPEPAQPRPSKPIGQQFDPRQY